MYARIDAFLVRCAKLDGLLMQNVSNSYERNTLLMQELEVGSSLHRYRTDPHSPDDNSRHQLTHATGHQVTLRAWMNTRASAYGSMKHSDYAWKLDHLRWPHSIEFGAALGICSSWHSWLGHCQWRLSCKGTYWRLIFSKETYESPCVVYLLEGQMNFHDIVLY